MDESTPLLKNKSNDSFHEIEIKSSSSSDIKDANKIQCQTYWYRWYICLIFALMGMLQGCIWNTWGPIDESAKVAFGFSASEVELLTNWGPITFLCAMPGFMWLLDYKGLRLPCVITIFLVALGSGLRCLPFDVSVLRYFIHAGQFLNGIAGCVVMAAPPLLSNVWFPPHERITATGIATLLNYMGTGLGYTVSLIVDDPSNMTRNNSCLHSHSYSSNDSCHEVYVIQNEVKNILYVEFGCALLVCISMFVYFPNHPPKPPSVSASLPRRNLKAGLMELRSHKQFWVVAMVMSLVIGTYSSWAGVMPIILNPLNISQKEAGMLGLIMSIAGSLTGMFIGWFTDKLKGKMKLVLTFLYIICLIMFLYFIIMSNHWIKGVSFLPVEIWVTCIVIGIAMNASVPLGMEMAADAGYPISEGTSTSIVVWLFNLLSFIFLLILGFVSNPLFANYIILACLVVSVPALIFFTTEENRRLELDTHPNDKQSSLDCSNGITNENYDPLA